MIFFSLLAKEQHRLCVQSFMFSFFSNETDLSLAKFACCLFGCLSIYAFQSLLFSLYFSVTFAWNVGFFSLFFLNIFLFLSLSFYSFNSLSVFIALIWDNLLIFFLQIFLLACFERISININKLLMWMRVCMCLFVCICVCVLVFHFLI